MRLVFLAWLALALPAMSHGDLHERIQAVTEQIAKSSNPAPLYLERAGLHAAHEEWPAAASDYDRAEALQADPVLVWLGRGKLRLATGHPADACATLDRLLAREPRHVDALVTRARAKAALKDTDGAANDYTTAITASARPEPEYFLERSSVLAGATPPRWDEAIRGLDQGLQQLGPGVVTLQLAAIDLETRAGRLDAALARIDRATATAPRTESWLVRRGDVLAKAERSHEAADAYQAALAAIAKLPPRARKTRAVADLETQARTALAALPAGQ
jgi:predicted Zn-dependent protease